MIKAPTRFRSVRRRTALAAAALLACGTSQAFEFETGNPDLTRSAGTTPSSTARPSRVKDRSPALSQTQFGPAGVVGPNNLNQDDGDNNFDKGLVSNRLDLLSELDMTWRNWGARVSGAAWYDPIYTRGNDNTSGTANHVRRATSLRPRRAS
jgi:hypothetical protein